MIKNFDLLKPVIENYPIEFKSDTIVRIKYADDKKVIEEMEFLKIIGSTEKGIRLSNGLLLTKGYLFPYHHKKNFIEKEEYYYLEKLKVSE